MWSAPYCKTQKPDETNGWHHYKSNQKLSIFSGQLENLWLVKCCSVLSHRPWECCHNGHLADFHCNLWSCTATGLSELERHLLVPYSTKANAFCELGRKKNGDSFYFHHVWCKPRSPCMVKIWYIWYMLYFHHKYQQVLTMIIMVKIKSYVVLYLFSPWKNHEN